MDLLRHYVDDAAHEIHQRWQEGEQGDDDSPTPLPDDLVRETAEAIVRPLYDDLKGAVAALEAIRDEANATPWYDAGGGLAEIVRLVDAALPDVGGQ